MNQTKRISISNVDLDAVALSLKQTVDNVVTSEVVPMPEYNRGELLLLEIDTTERPVDFVMLNDALQEFSVTIIEVAPRGDIIAFWLTQVPCA